MPVALDVDPEVYVDAGLVFLRANGDTCDLVNAAASAAGEGGGMAGTDTGGVQWAAGYDGTAAAALSAGSTLADGLGHLGDLLDRTAANHAGADAASVVTPHGVVDPPAYCTGTSSGPGSQSVVVATPPSANATDDDPPVGWSLVAHLVEYTWPNGHQDRLRRVAAGWRTAADALHPVADSLTPAVGDISALQSPEVDQAVATCTTVQLAARDLADAYATLAQACDDYAGHLDDAHSQVIQELTLFAVESAGVQLLAAVLAAPTAGGSEVAAQGVQLAKTAATAAKISTVLARFAEFTAEVLSRIEPVLSHSISVENRLREILDKSSTQFPAVAAAAAAVPTVPLVNLWAIETGRSDAPHTIDRHVGKDDDYLKQRKIAYASTFPDVATAEWADTQNIVHNEAEIAAWLADPDAKPVKPFFGPLPGDCGRIWDRKAGVFISPTRIRTTLMRTPTGYTILTSFPEP